MLFSKGSFTLEKLVGKTIGGIMSQLHLHDLPWPDATNRIDPGCVTLPKKPWQVGVA
jgi:hypothetical protein